MMRPTTTTAFSTRRGMAGNAGGRRSRLMILLGVGIIGICIFGKRASPRDNSLDSSYPLFPLHTLGDITSSRIEARKNNHGVCNSRSFLVFSCPFPTAVIVTINRLSILSLSIQVKYHCLLLYHVLRSIVARLVLEHTYQSINLPCLIDDYIICTAIITCFNYDLQRS